MLVPPRLSTEISSPLSSRPWAPYKHLVGGADPYLGSSTCLYFDGVPYDRLFGPMLDLVQEWFGRFDFKPKVLLVDGDKQTLSSRYSMKSLKEAVAQKGIVEAIEAVQFFPKGRTTVDDTWRPSIYFALSRRNPASAFFAVNTALSEERTVGLLLEGDKVLESSAAYGFLFPTWFSPLGYYWGISVDPSYKVLGKWGSRESQRLSYWRDNTVIGIEQGGRRRTFSACDGYVRDVFPLMLLGERQLSRPMAGRMLVDFVQETGVGENSSQNGKLLWRVRNEALTCAQEALDAAGLTLSGRPLDIG